MKIFIRAKPKAQKEEVIQIDQTHFKVSVKEPPIDGRANWAIERAISKFLHVSPTRVRIVAGHTSKNKVVEILSD